jgi:hypothetical protein
MKKIMGLCQGRHSIATNEQQIVDSFIFTTEVNPIDLHNIDNQVHAALYNCSELELYVTGLTVALVSVINYCLINYIPLTLWHYNRDTNSYYSQKLHTTRDLDLLIEAGYIRQK